MHDYRLPGRFPDCFDPVKIKLWRGEINPVNGSEGAGKSVNPGILNELRRLLRICVGPLDRRVFRASAR